MNKQANTRREMIRSNNFSGPTKDHSVNCIHRLIALNWKNVLSRHLYVLLFAAHASDWNWTEHTTLPLCVQHVCVHLGRQITRSLCTELRAGEITMLTACCVLYRVWQMNKPKNLVILNLSTDLHQCGWICKWIYICIFLTTYISDGWRYV